MEYDDFLWFIKERQSIRFKKDIGCPSPWTDDPILDKCHFLNIHTMHDPGTIRLHDFIEGMTDWEKLFYIFTYRTVYSSSRFIGDMSEIWMHDYRNLKLFNWKTYSDRQPYSYHLGSYTVKQFAIDISLPVMKVFWEDFHHLERASIIDVEESLALLFFNKTGRKQKLLCSIITNDIALQFPDKVDPDSKSYQYISARQILNKMPGRREEQKIKNLLQSTNLNYSSLNRALNEFHKYQTRKKYYEDKGCLREEWLIKAL
ncbi:MAG: putative DNA base hypermodification protein [Sphaerochaetaceae bacterium]|nr:putative DNA base hypermodification protein [Sphaerochaetaceae bacterium]